MVTIEMEKDIVAIVENAIDKLNVVKENAQKENKQIVRDLARDFEGIIPMDSICTEIIHRLHGHLSARTIRKYLDEKYKVKSRVDNARKQNKNNQSSLAASGPLNNGIGRMVVNDRNDISFPGGDNKQPYQPSEISSEDSKSIQSVSQKESLNSTEQKQPSVDQINTEITECSGCMEREGMIKELEEAHQKIQQFATADKIEPSTVETERFERPEEPLEFEASITGWEIRNYFRSQKIKSYDEAIWFSGRIDRISGKIIHFDLGRLDWQL